MGKILVTGSLAYDYIMHFADIFSNHLLPDKLHILNVSFTAHKMSKNFGGTAGNIAYSLRRLQEIPVIFSTVGRDFQEYAAKLANDGIATETIHVHPDEWTASAHIITDNEDNQITAFYGGAMLKNDISIAPILADHDISLAIIAANGRDGMLKYAAELKQRQIPYIYDPGQSLPSFDGKQLITLVDGAYIIVMNEYETQLFLTKTRMSQEELLGKVEYLIVTQGEKGTVIHSRAGKIEVVPAKAKEVKDPTGAGDAFRGGLLKGIIHGLSIETSVQLASLAGCYAVEHEGTQSYRYRSDEYQRRFVEAYGDHLDFSKLFTCCQPE